MRATRSLSDPRIVVALMVLTLVVSVAASPVLAEGSWSSGWPQGQPANRITNLAVSPADGRLVYASTIAALYSSADGGASWSMVSALANISSLVIDPSNPAILYAHCWPLEADSPGPKGLKKSVDGGRTWSDLTLGAPPDPREWVTLLTIDLASPRTVFAGTVRNNGFGRIWRSVDGGATWQATYEIQSIMGAGRMTALVVSPANSRVVWAAHDSYHGGAVLRSDDGGLSWRFPAAVPQSLSFPDALATDPRDENVAYAAAQLPMGGGVVVYRTDNGGASWSKASDGLPSGSAFSPHLATNPNDPRVLYLSLQGAVAGVYRTVNRGASWAKMTADGLPSAREVSTLAYHEGWQTLFVGAKEGVWQAAVLPTIADSFVGYYNRYDGTRVMGRPISAPTESGGSQSQYFEKARLEDHSQEVSNPNWKFMYRLLADQLQEAKINLAVGGDASTISYASIHDLASAERRLPAPTGFSSGTQQQPDDSTFVPFSAQLAREAGHNVAATFWSYINRSDLFPGGWLHDVGLPTTEAVMAVVDKGAVKGRQIVIQAFQRAVLTYDALNPGEWQVERANVGTDYAKAFPDQVK